MKPTSNASESAPILVFGAHPDDIEFGCGGVIARESQAGRKAHFVVCSRGETGSFGTPERRVAEAKKAAELLGATIEFTELDGDGRLELRAAHAVKMAEIIRRIRPHTVLAPSLVENQHPDHWRLGKLARDGARLSRFGGLGELRELAPHSIRLLFFYAITAEAVPADITPIFIDVSAPEVLATWRAAMEAHSTQVVARNYVEIQLVRARLLGARAGIDHAMALFPNDPLVFGSLAQAGWGARAF